LVRVDKYVTLHDAGRVLNPAPFDGQVRGGFAMAVGAALYEQLAYAEDGWLHLRQPFGLCPADRLDDPGAGDFASGDAVAGDPARRAKGVAEGNSISMPVCIANAVADALGVAEVSLPLTPERLLEMVSRRGQ